MSTTIDRDQDVPVVDFDHHSAEFARDPWRTLRRLREESPVAWSERYGGFWVLTRYDDIKQVALDDQTFSSAETILIPPKKNAQQKSIPIEMDPPDFLEYRRVMHPMFSPVAVDRLDPVIEHFTHRCIDGFIERGEADFVHELADPLPAMTTLYKLGLPLEHWPRFAEPLHKTVFLRQDNPLREGVLEQLGWMRQTLVDAIADRRATPRDDMITYLTQSQVNGEPVSDNAVLEMIMLTCQGGFDTTGSAISSALIYLDRNRDARQHLIDHPEDRDRVLEMIQRGMRLWDELPTHEMVHQREVWFQEGLADLADVVGDYEIWPGRRLLDTTPRERQDAADAWSEEMKRKRLKYMGLDQAGTS